MTRINDMEEDIAITREKWQNRYLDSQSDKYKRSCVPSTVKISSGYARNFLFDNKPESGILLEAGCGTARTSLDVSFSGELTIICVDISMGALEQARKLFKENNPSAKVYFVCCDLRTLPFKGASIGHIFSDGAIEHFRDTGLSVKEFYRVLKSGGRVFATVPCVSFSMFTYGQLQGNIPDIFLLRNLFEVIHIKMLRSKLMTNGYELSFIPGKIRGIFKNAGFKYPRIGLFDTFNEIKFVRNQFLKQIFRRLTKMRMFWPLIYIFAEKQ
ncbi:MAG: class I SAM-dependent methyltransferase [Candidatus Omnitrophota bacterium]